MEIAVIGGAGPGIRRVSPASAKGETIESVRLLERDTVPARIIIKIEADRFVDVIDAEAISRKPGIKAESLAILNKPILYLG